MTVAAPLLFALLQVAAPVDSSWVRNHDVAVRMRDGVVLRADVFRPAERGRFPTLVYRSPYGKDDEVREYTTVRRAVERGYAVVVQDVRGRYASDGAFDPYRQEGRDGYDTIEWAAAQTWSNGLVGTFGLSYPGAVQWLAAIESPPSLRTMVPAMTFASPRRFFYTGGVWDLSWAAWTWFNIAPDLRVRSGAAGPRTPREVSQSWRRESARVLAQRPLLELPDFKAIAPWYYEWMQREPTDPWWDFAELAGRYGRTNAAVLNLSGWHDEAYGPHGAIANFSGLVRARAGADPRTRLVVGPWVHGVDATGTTRSGERRFGANAAIDYDDLVLDWMDRWLKGVVDGARAEPRVRVYVMGANEWREGDAWPLPGLRRDTLWFGPQRALTPRPPAAAREGSTFLSDPTRPVRDPYDAAYGAHDYRALARRGDVLTFETPPLTTPVEVIGAMTAELFLETDARDVDVYVQVLDVAPDATAYNLMSPGLGLLRASYRDPTGRRPLEPGRVHELRLGDLLTANRFQRGHRIRVHILGAFLPHFSLNPQTGESERTSAALQRARITIRHDATYASRLILPVAPIATR